jgi:hypothetical protein
MAAPAWPKHVILFIRRYGIGGVSAGKYLAAWKAMLRMCVYALSRRLVVAKSFRIM